MRGRKSLSLNNSNVTEKIGVRLHDPPHYRTCHNSLVFCHWPKPDSEKVEMRQRAGEADLDRVCASLSGDDFSWNVCSGDDKREDRRG